MKLLLLVTSLALTSGTALGYWTGKGSAETGFASGCATQGIVVVFDPAREAHRHFHCFELETTGAPAESEGARPTHRSDSGQVFAL